MFWVKSLNPFFLQDEKFRGVLLKKLGFPKVFAILAKPVQAQGKSGDTFFPRKTITYLIQVKIQNKFASTQEMDEFLNKHITKTWGSK